MDRKRLIVLAVALVAACSAALLVRGMLGGGTPRGQAKTAPEIAMSEVLVASVNLTPGQAVTAEQVRWATKAAQRHGIQVGMFLMWGYEGETLEDMEATVEHVKAANPDVFFTTVAYPIKNTGYFESAAASVVATRAWEEGTDRDHAIRGRHSRAFYKQADRWLRAEVAADHAAALAAREAMAALDGEVEA